MYLRTVMQFYADLETTLDDILKKDIVIIAGDWNAKVGSDNNGWERVMVTLDMETRTIEENGC